MVEWPNEVAEIRRVYQAIENLVGRMAYPGGVGGQLEVVTTAPTAPGQV